MLFYTPPNRREFRNLITAILAAPPDNNVSVARYGGIHQKTAAAAVSRNTLCHKDVSPVTTRDAHKQETSHNKKNINLT